jgi:hypothetical protein
VGDCSENAVAKVQALYQSKEIALEYLLDVLARAVEINPSDKASWYRLVNSLADLEQVSPEVERSKGGVDGDIPGQCWCKERCNEWQESYFQSPPSSSEVVKSEFVSMVIDAIDLDFVSIKLYNDTNVLEEQLSTCPECEALCLRIVVAYHMSGKCSFVCNSIWWLSVKQWKSNQQGDTSNIYLIGLKWLTLHGFNIIEYLISRIESSLEYERESANNNISS